MKNKRLVHRVQNRFSVLYSGLFITAFLLAGHDPVLGQDPMAINETSAYVVQLYGRLAFVDKGRGDGLFTDQFLQLVRHESIIHPVTGEDLGGEVPLGAARVVEVFEKLATAEIVELAFGMDLETLEMEVGAGKIRVRELPREESAALRARVEMTPKASGKGMVLGGLTNPEGPVKGLIPDLEVLFGGSVETGLPSLVYELIPDAVRFESLSDSVTVSLADTTGDLTLANFNGSRQLSLALQMPLSDKFSVRAEFGVGSESRLALGGTFHPGQIFNFVGEGYTPDGQVGAPGFTLMIGSGGRGARSLPQDVETRIVADAGSVAQVVRLTDPTATDSAIAVEVQSTTNLLRRSAEDSLDQISRRGTGYKFAMTLPYSDRLTLRTSLTSFGNIREFLFGTTYYLKPVRPNVATANPDGTIRSLVIGSDLIYNLEISQIFLNLNLKIPLSRTLTLRAGLLSDLSTISRFGLSLKSYLKSF